MNMALLRIHAVLLFFCFVDASFARTLQRKKENSADEPVKWIVSVERNGKNVCEGVQVNKELFLTLGDCIQPKKMKKYKIVMFNGEVRDVQNQWSSSVGKMLVLLKTSISYDVEQDYPGLPAAKYDKALRMFTPDKSGNLEATAITFVSDDNCIEQGDFSKYKKKKHDCFTAEPAPSSGCLLKAGRPIFVKVKKEWVLYAFSTAEADLCDATYKQSTKVAPHRRWVKKMLKDCGLLPPIVNGFSKLDNAFSSSIGSTASVTCEKAYTSNKPTIACQTNGEWQEAECIINDCGSLPSVIDGSVSLDSSSSTVGSTATVSCISGYNPSNATITCKASGHWETATCNLTDCGFPVSGESWGFDLMSMSTTVGTEAYVSCRYGYENATAAIITCQESGDWEETTCAIKGYDLGRHEGQEDCGLPYSDESVHVDLSTTSTTFGSKANVSCSAGLDANVATITCQASGVWETATCTLKDCGLPVSDGSWDFDLVTMRTWYGSEANVSCKDGYTNPSAATITCQASGVWETATCTIKDCGQPVADKSVRYDLSTSVTTFGSYATVSCNAGYDSPSATVIACQSSGFWETANCTIKDCGSPISDGSVSFILSTSSTTFGSEANISCNAGYESASTAAISCQASGIWETANCTLKDCGLPVSDGSVRFKLSTSSNTLFGSEATVSCIAGYENASVAIINCQASGVWETATCKLKDCGLPESDGSVRFNLSTSSTTFGSEATVSCNSGFESANAATITCQASGVWTTATCTIKDCGYPESDVSVRFDLLTSSTTFGVVATVSCSAGYESASATTITCQASGLWETAACTIKDCGYPVSDGSVRFSLLTSSTTYESSATVWCNAGYESLSTAAISCLESGVWETATCTIKDCGSPVTDGSVHFDLLTSSTTFGSVATVSCNAGYESASAASITCLASGGWETATCFIKDCGSPISDDSVRFDLLTSITTFGSEANVSCNAGYHASATIIACLATGIWESASCIIKDCGLPISDGSVQFDLLSTSTFGSKASVSCKTGYESASAATITCLASGVWETATCTIKDCGTLPSISNGSLSLDSASTSYQSEATVTCFAEYRPSTYSEKISCESTGFWTSVKCELICTNSNEKTDQTGTRFRLCDGDGSDSNGRLEVFQENEWGTVCSDFWDINNHNSEVTCKMFGYSRGTKVSAKPGWGPIWMDNVDCISRFQYSLMSCFRGISSYIYYTRTFPITTTYGATYTGSVYTSRKNYDFYEIGQHNCDHNKDVGISCIQ